MEIEKSTFNIKHQGNSSNEEFDRQQGTSESDYKVFVFDLDNTLYLHKVDVIQKQIYHEQVKIFLQNLKDAGKILCIATHNKYPTLYLDRLKISSLFHYIISEQKKVHPMHNSIRDYTGKDEMIKELICKIGCTNEEIIFFDDAIYNTNKVESIGVKSILVSDQTGIEFDKLGEFLVT
jgi:HAD superfamily phosphatase (TIGR01681 family)